MNLCIGAKYTMRIFKGECMKVEELLAISKCNLSEVARVLGITAPAAYKWLKTGVVPPLRVYELREKKPEWFVEKNDG